MGASKLTICETAFNLSIFRSSILKEFCILGFYESSSSSTIFALHVWLIVTLHVNLFTAHLFTIRGRRKIKIALGTRLSAFFVSFVNSEAAVQRCYIKIGVMKILRRFQQKTRGQVLIKLRNEDL